MPNLVQFKVFLEGAYESGNLMENNLQAILPTTSPYTVAPWNYDALTTSLIPATAVDWVAIQAIDAVTQQIVETKSAFLRNDGSVVDVNGNLGVLFDALTIGSDYHFMVRHRNHVDVMGTQTITFPTTSVYDLTNPANVMGGAEQLHLLFGNTYGLNAGDINGDGIVNVTDFNQYVGDVANNESGYHAISDCNLNGTLTVDDFNLYNANASLIGISAVRF